MKNSAQNMIDTSTLPSHSEILALPRLQKGQKLDLKSIRVPSERLYSVFVYLPTVIGTFILLILGIVDFTAFLVVAAIIALIAVSSWIGWKLTYPMLLGHSIKVGPTQYSQIHALVYEASEILGIEAPTVLIMQGHGLFEALVMKFYSRRGLLILTSDMLDDLTEHRSSRELMFFIGRQLGLIATGYFRFWWIKHAIGVFSLIFYFAWLRRCHMTADRLGLLVAGDLYSAEQALIPSG